MINIYLCDDEDRIRDQIQSEIEKKILIEPEIVEGNSCRERKNNL